MPLLRGIYTNYSQAYHMAIDTLNLQKEIPPGG